MNEKHKLGSLTSAGIAIRIGMEILKDTGIEAFEDKTITLISNFEMYKKEKSGIKPNTLRDDTPRLRKMLDGAIYVKIRKGYTKEFFIRKITDVTHWKKQSIISWNPNEVD